MPALVDNPLRVVQKTENAETIRENYIGCTVEKP